MTYDSTLEAVREISERATTRPAPKHLHLATAGDQPRGPKPAPATWEELHPPSVKGGGGTAGDYRPRQLQATDRCTRCHKRPEYCYCDVINREKDFLELALEKTEAQTERRPVVIPRGN